jgi:EAL domain-containing protein (putative c-di-GMP-specific phosphodiesterase class I)
LAKSGLFLALRRREFSLYYQPQYALRSGELVGLEGFLRWQNPRDGIRLPKDFVPAAEESGLIVDIGAWALESACHQLAVWRDQGVAPPRLALNVSVQQLRMPDFAGLVGSTLQRHGLQAQLLELEISESVFAEEEARMSLRQLAALGVRLALGRIRQRLFVAELSAAVSGARDQNRSQVHAGSPRESAGRHARGHHHSHGACA